MVDFGIPPKTGDLKCDDVAAVGCGRCASAAGWTWNGASVCLDKTNLNHSPNVITVSVDSSFPARTKLKKFVEGGLLGSWNRVPNWILEVVWPGDSASVGIRVIQPAKSCELVAGGGIKRIAGLGL